MRNRQTAAAIDVLLDSSKRARPDLAAQFTVEAARIATSAGEFDRARTLLSGLLSADPVRADYLAAMADTYLQAKDDRGFRDFEIETIARLKSSPLTPSDRLARIASIRRGLIPALDRLHDNAGAVDQYIAVIDSYPEDETLTREAAAYALAHGQGSRMAAYYRKTIGEAPRDYRWPIVLGRIETVAEDYASAIGDYERAIRNRPDRANILEAKARLEERLVRFDDAVKSYTRLYDLTYRDPQWMVKVAELHARSGRSSEAVSALRTAMIGARTENAYADFAIAEHLENWHILSDALAFAERGAALAGGELGKTYGYATAYARIVTRARRMDLLLDRFGADPNVMVGVAAAAGQIVAETYTPEEKVRLEQLLAAQPRRPGQDRYALLQLLQTAGLVDLEARWRLEAMSSEGAQIDARLATLQAQRGVYGEWAGELERYAATHSGQPVEAAALNEAAAAFHSEEDRPGELRVMRASLARNALGGATLDRYFHLLLVNEPNELIALARGGASDEIRNHAANVAFSADRAELAYNAVRARGASLPPVWTGAFTALAGHYLDDHTAAIDAAFQNVLDARTIAERLRQRRTGETAILGRVWFYYGARYGEHLATGGRAADSEAWLPATVEAAPENADVYVALGDWYAANRQVAKALARYDQALQLDADRGDAHDHAARLLWAAGRRAEAVSRWKAAIATFVAIQSRGILVPEPFWGRVALTFTDIGQSHAIPELRGDMSRLLADYERRNHEYRFRELFDPAARATVAAGESLNWLVELAQSTTAPEFLVESLLRTPGLTGAERIAVQRGVVATLESGAGEANGDDREYAARRAVGARLFLITMLLDAGDVTGATAEWRRVPPAPPTRNPWERDPSRDAIEIRLAAKHGALSALLDRYRSEPAAAPPERALREIADLLQGQREIAAARALLGFVYDRELRNGKLEAPNFLGLAEVRLQEGNANDAVALLNRMALVLPDGFDTLTRSAELLAKYNQRPQAI